MWILENYKLIIIKYAQWNINFLINEKNIKNVFNYNNIVFIFKILIF